jgi:hypothetical protein
MNTSLNGIFFDSKYSKATGSRMLLMPSVLSSSKSAGVSASFFNISGFHVCSSHETLTPLSKFFARLKANTRWGESIGLLFAIILCAIMSSITKKVHFTRSNDLFFKELYFIIVFFTYLIISLFHHLVQSFISLKTTDVCSNN